MVLQNKGRKFHHVNDITDIREFQMSRRRQIKSIKLIHGITSLKMLFLRQQGKSQESNRFRLLFQISKIQLVVYYQCYVLIG